MSVCYVCGEPASVSISTHYDNNQTLTIHYCRKDRPKREGER